MSDTFTILVRELTRAERKLLLARILAAGGIEEAEARPAPQPVAPRRTPEEEYAALPALARLFIILKRVFTGKSVGRLTEEHLLRELQHSISNRAPGLVDFAAGRLTSRMRLELEGLRAPLAALRSLLAGVVERRDFVAFLAGLELDPLNERITQETDPRIIASEPLHAESHPVRSEMTERLGRILEEIPRERRLQVQKDVQRLRAIDALTGIRLEELIILAGPAGEGLQAGEKGERLRPLLDALTAASEAPLHTAWNALFLYRASAELVNPAYDMEKHAASFTARAATAHAAVRSFLERVPLLDIVRGLTENLDYAPRPADGGEAWIALFRRFWEDRLEGVYREHLRERGLEECISRALALCGLSALPLPEAYRKAGSRGSPLVRHETAFTIFKAFHQSVFLPRMERGLKIVSVNGDFYKEDNRDAFMAGFSGIGAAAEACRRLEARLSPGGDLCSRLAGLEGRAGEQGAPGKVRTVWDEANREARKALDAARASLGGLGRVLFGLLYGEVGGQYDTLTNLGSLGGRENKMLLASLDAAMSLADRAADLMGEALGLEGAAEG
jgi:hypothetical protein